MKAKVPPFDWVEYMTLASQLSNTKTEACMRSAISRSYYYAYNVTKKYVKKKVESVPPNDHIWLWRKMTELSMVSGFQSWGERIRLARNKADYDERFDDLENQVKMVMMNVMFIVQELKKH